MTNISNDLAKKIVDAIKQICGYDINFIDKKGLIIASTNEKRINTFHQGGLEAINTNKTIIVDNDNDYEGTKKGINSPIFINNEPIAVIGVSGEPSLVSKYVFLAIKITEIFLTENILKENLSNKNNQINYIIQTFLYVQKEKYKYAFDFLQRLNIDFKCKYYVVKIILNERYNLNNIKLIEKHIEDFFISCNCVLNTYIYPFEFIGFLPENTIDLFKNNLKDFSLSNKEILKIGIGNSVNIEDINISYKNANISISYIKPNENFKFYEDFSLEILLNSIPKELKESYIKNIIDKLNKDEITLLKIYFENNMELKTTAKNLFIHINTLQYKLDKIYKKIGFNPRVFKDANFLYLLILLL